METSAPLIVDVVSDIVCPWCFIGKRKLEQALDELARTDPSTSITVRWHPFQLNPDLPPEGIPRTVYLTRKFGSASGAAERYAHVTSVGETVGIPFRFDRIEQQPNTLDGHRLIAWAQQQDDAGRLMERLFNAYFVEGRRIGDPDELARLAAECGWSEDDARDMLATDELREEVETASRRASEMGIEGVPFFIFDQRTALSGAHDARTILDAISEARSKSA